MSPGVLEQTLHGYTQGHRLVAASPGVNAEERALLDRLSDLSGYLPIGLRFDVYHTGFPCGRYYALCATWPDAQAPRGGAVLTHTLLIPWAVLDAEPAALERAWALLRRPAGVSAPGYDRPVTWAPGPPPLAPPFGGERARAAVVLLLGTPSRPIVWVDPERPDDVVRGLWSLLWPAARRELSFCTLALAPRQVGGRVFTFLGVPPEARGAFVNLGMHPAWWDHGQLRDPGLAARAAEPWVQQVLEGGAARLSPLVERAREALPALAPADVPLLLRLEELSQGARERLPAARSRADLLASQLPQLPATHPWWRAALSDLLQRQADAPLAPRPLWDLTDLLSRTQTQALAAEPAFLQRLEDVVGRELLSRLKQAPGPTCAGLEGLVSAMGDVPALGEVLAPLLGRAVAQAGSLEAAEPIVRVTLGQLSSVSAATEVLRPLPEEARAAVVDGLAGADAALGLAERLMAAAEALDDLGLAFRAGQRLQGSLAGLAAAGRIAARSPTRLGELEALLAAQDPGCVLDWALDVDDPVLAQTAAAAGARAAERLALGLAQLGERCAGRASGELVFAERARSAPRSELLALADTRPELTELVLAATERAPNPELVRSLALALPPRLEDGSLSPSAAARWLGFRGLRDALQRAAPYAIYPRSGRPGPGLLLPLLEALAEAGPGLPLEPLVDLLRLALVSADREALDRSAPLLVALLSRPLRAEGRALLLGELLGAVSRHPPARGPELVLLAFPEVYPQVHAGERRTFSLLSWWFDAGWDRAKRWRHWLVDVWVAERWPPPELLRVVQATPGSDKLYAQVARRAWKTPGGQELMRRALASLDADPALAARWRGPLEQLLRHGPPDSDHD